MDRQTDWLTEEQNTRFAWAGGTCPRIAWAGETISPVVQFLVLAGYRFWFYILLMYLGYRTIQLWCCVSFFGIFFVVARKWFWREIGSFLLWREIFITTGKKRYSCLSGGCVINYDRKKKDTVVCLMGARFWRLRPEKKDTVVCLADARSFLRPEKNHTVVCLVGARSCLSFLSWSLYFVLVQFELKLIQIR